MKTIGAGLQTHLESETTTLATCWKITRRDATVLGFTDHDAPLVISGVTYAASTGYSASDVSNSADLNVDELELSGILESPSITEDDLRAGLWDFAEVRIFMVNWANLAQGEIKLRKGTLGEVRLTERGQFQAELRGMMQAYSRSIGRIDSPSCNADLGDARCGIDLGDWTVSGTIDAVNDDQITLYDAARTEAGAPDPVAITGVTNADPGVITAAAHGFTEGQAVTITGLVGPIKLNTVGVVHNPTTDSFDLGVDTTDTGDYPAYVSGGQVVALGASGYFDGGLITMTSGYNVGLSMEIKSYVVGQFTLHLPFPYVVAIGDTYTLSAGCAKTLATCRDRFDNVVNFRGFPYIPGIDAITQVGRHT